MAVQGQPQSVYAGVPIDESTRREATAVGKSNRANGNVRQDDRLALRKRPGFTALSRSRDTGTRTTGRKLFAHDGAPCVIDGTFLDCFIEASGVSFVRSRAPELTYRIDAVPSFSTSAGVLGDYANGFVAYTSGLTLVAVEVASGILIQSVPISTAAAFVTSIGNRYLVALIPQSGPYLNVFDTQNPASGWSSISWVGTGMSSVVCAVGTDRFAAAWISGGGGTVNVATYDVTGLQLANTTVTASGLGASNAALALSYNGGKLWLSFADTGNLKAVALDPTSLAVVSTLATATTYSGTVRGVTASADTAGNARLMFVSTTFVKIISVKTTAGATVASSTAFQLNGVSTGLSNGVGRAFFINGRHYVGVYGGVSTNTTTNTQGLLTIVDWTDDASALRPVAHIEPGLVSNWTFLTPDPTTGKFYFLVSCVASGVNRVQSIASGDTVLNLRLVELDYQAKGRWQTAPLGESTFISGAVLSVFDGSSLTEAVFVASPPQPSTSLSGTGLTGTYRYVAIYEDVDAAGNWVESGISAPSASVSPANQAVAVSVPPLCVTSRASKPTLRVAFYRTLTGGNAPYYRVGVVTNDITATSITFTDQVSDAVLSAKGKLYAPNLPGTAGESLDRRAPPGLVDLCAYNGMLVGIKGDTVYYSGQPVYGEAAWFNPVFAVPVYGGDDFVAIAAIDGTLYLFKADRIFAVSGDVPSDNGLQGGLGQPRLLASDVGCIDVDSVVATSLGIFFRSPRGIELLDRSGAVQFVGNNVFHTVDANPITTSAVLDERNGLVRYSLAATQSFGLMTGTGVDLVFDLTLGGWISTDTRTGASASEPAQCAAVVHNRSDWRYAWLGTNGTVYVEKDLTDSDACLDGSTWVQSTWELPPWNLGLQVEQVNFGAIALFDRAGAAGLVIEEADSYSTTYAPLHTWSETETLGQRQLEFRPIIRTSAVQLRARDTAPAVLGGGQGITFIGITFDIGANQGPNRGTPRLSSGLRK